MSFEDELKEEKFEAMLKPALLEHMAQEMAREEMPEIEHEFSKSFERKMNRFMRRLDPTYRRNMRLITAAVVVSVVAVGVVTVNVEAFRLPIQNMFMGEKSATIESVGKREEVVVPEEYREYVPEYVVDGFELEYAYKDIDRCYLEYANEDRQTYFVEIYKDTGRTSFDSEQGEVSKIKIGAKDAVMMEKNSKLWVSFDKKGMKYAVEGDVGLEEIEKIVESVKEN